MIKVHGRCDLACDHCYVYELADQSWLIKPRAMAPEILALAAERIAEHARAHEIADVRVVLHGGEPLLLGHERLRRALELLRSTIDPVARLDLRVHTNGVRLDERLCELFRAGGVKVGVSLDGDRVANDLHRRFRDGRSSHAAVLRALALLRRPEYRQIYSGLLCTIDLRNDPIAVYEALLAEEPPRLDFLLPHATWDRPPARPPDTSYGEWLGRIYRRWTEDGRPVPIRLFDSILDISRGGRSETEALGLDPVDLLVIDTNGDWEQADSLKVAFDGAPATATNVRHHSVDAAAAHPAVAARRSGLKALCATCKACPVVDVCGGGLYAHRYGRNRGFDNPSVYCADLKTLINQVKDMPPRVQSVTRHTLPPEAFDVLAAGPGDLPGLTSLAEMRLSLTRALVASVAAEPYGGDVRLNETTEAGWELLCDLDTTHPDAVREVFAHPFTQEWAVRCLRPPDDADGELDRAHLAGLAAAAALRAGRPEALDGLPLPVRDGAVHLPTLGAVRAPAGHGRTVRLSPEHRTPWRWRRVRRLDADGLTVTVEDLDPFRDCRSLAVTDRLTDAQWQAWSRVLTEAFDELKRRVPGYAAVVAAGLRAVVPLRAAPPGSQFAATARQAFGAISLGYDGDAEVLSEFLLHEFQHVKLYALLDLYDLFDTAYERHIAVPWHPQPRPVEGVLHGAYAHLAVAELWRARPGRRAREHFSRCRSWVWEALDSLELTGVLTDDGRRFVRGMRNTIEG